MTRYTLKYPGVIYFFYALIVLLGWQALKIIPRQESPDFPKWNAIIVTQMPGASPQKVEELVTEKIEEKLTELSEIENIDSISQTGVSYVTIKLKESIEDVDPVWEKVRQKVDEMPAKLPAGVRPFFNNDFGKVKAVVLAITGDGFSNHELTTIAKDLKRDLGRVKYVARIDLVGSQEERVFLEASVSKLSESGISPQLFMNILAQQNILVPGGQIQVGPQSIILEPTGEFNSVEDISNTVIAIPGNKNLLLLKDLVTIRREYVDPPQQVMRYMGQQAIGLSIEMEEGGQSIEMGENVKKFIEDKKADLYHGIDIHIVNFEPRWVEKKMSEFTRSLIEALFLVVVPLMLLMGYREGFITAMLIPFTMLIAFIVMRFLDIPFQQISIASLIISLGMLVDNGIVVTESIANCLAKGMSKFDAAIESGKHLAIPLITSTATIVVAFLPIAMAKSGVGIYCRSMPTVVGIVLGSSLFVAMTLVPLMSLGIMKPHHKAADAKPKRIDFAALYERIMIVCLRRKYLTVAIVFVSFLAVMQLGQFVRNVFFPPSDRFIFSINFYLPEGTDSRVTAAKAVAVEQYLLDKYSQDMENMALYIGAVGPMFYGGVSGDQGSTNYAQFVITNVDLKATERMVKELKVYFDSTQEDVNVVIRKLEAGPPVGAPVQLKVYGKDLNELYSNARKVEDILRQTKGTRDIKDDWGNFVPKLSIAINQSQARLLGVSTQSIAQSLSGILSGTVVTNYREGDTSIPLIYRSVAEERNVLGKLESLSIPSINGTSIPLLQVARLDMKWETGKIKHYNRYRTITINAYLEDGVSLSEVTKEVNAKLSEIPFNPGNGVKFKGSAEESQKANESIAVQIPAAVALLVMILVWQFANIRKTLIVMLTIPLGWMGVIFGLLSTDMAFGFMAFVGVISLAGLELSNGILLLDQIELDLKDGKSILVALISAGQRRAYPIFLTKMTAITGLIPLAISGDFWGPMAVSMIGGMIVATLLTIVVVPVFYAILFRIDTSKIGMPVQPINPTQPVAVASH